MIILGKDGVRIIYFHFRLSINYRQTVCRTNPYAFVCIIFLRLKKKIILCHLEKHVL